MSHSLPLAFSLVVRLSRAPFATGRRGEAKEMLRLTTKGCGWAARRSSPRATRAAARRIGASAVTRADLVRDLYLRELKNYKAPATSPNDHQGHVKQWTVPTPATPPAVEVDEGEVGAYEAQQVEIEGGAAAADAGDDWFEEKDP